jgi:hypothetical protein
LFASAEIIYRAIPADKEMSPARRAGMSMRLRTAFHLRWIPLEIYTSLKIVHTFSVNSKHLDPLNGCAYSALNAIS